MRVRFIPQRYESSGIVTFEWEVGDIPNHIESRSPETDRYGWQDNASPWCRYWPGPFKIEILRGKTK